MFGKCINCRLLCKKIPFGSLVSSRIRFRNEMECDRHSHSWRSLEQSCRTHDAEPQWKWSTDISCHQRIGPRSIEKQRRWKIIQSLLRGWSNHWDNFTHCCFCESAQYSRGCPRFVWRILSTTDRFRENFCSYGTIRVNGSTYWFVEYSKTASNQWARTGWPIAQPQRKSAESFGWGTLDQIVHRFSFCQDSCPWTTFHDKRCWMILRIWWACWMPRVHLTSRWWILNTQRLDSWKYEHWFCIGSGDHYHPGKMGIEIRIDSFSGEWSQSWVRISNGLNTFVRDLTEKTRNLCETEEILANTGQLVFQEPSIVEHSRRETDKPIAKAKPKPTSNPLPSSSTEQIPIPGRKLIEIELQEHMLKDAQRFSFWMIALLRHGNLPRDEGGTVEFWRLKAEFKSAFPNSVHWSIRLWIDHLQKRRRTKEDISVLY